VTRVALAEERADVGLGIEAAARQLKLDFVPLIDERWAAMTHSTSAGKSDAEFPGCRAEPSIADAGESLLRAERGRSGGLNLARRQVHI
jgi:hypothetical protein